MSRCFEVHNKCTFTLEIKLNLLIKDMLENFIQNLKVGIL